MSSYVVRGKPLPSGAGSFRIVRRVSAVTLMMPCGRVFETVNGMACPSIITRVVSPSTKVRSISRFLTKFVKSSSTFKRMSTGANVMLNAVLTFAGLNDDVFVDGYTSVFACEAVDADDVAVLVFAVSWPSNCASGAFVDYFDYVSSAYA